MHEKLLRDFPYNYLPAPWVKFRDASGFRWCQPDGLLLNIEDGTCRIVEVKYQHTADAWWQLTQLYLPVLEVLFSPLRWTHSCLEIVKWYDPVTSFPGKVVFAKSVQDTIPKGYTGVHIFNPQREQALYERA